MAYSLTQNHSLLVQKSATAFFRGSSSKTLRRRPLSQEQPRLLRFRRGALAFKQSVKNNLGDACRVGTRNFTLNQSRPLSTATYRAVPESSEDMVEDASESLWLMSQAQKAAGLATFLAADMFLKKAFVAANIAFPSALGGMFVILGTLLALEAVSNSTVDFLFSIFKPALDWIARWLPLFYMPSLIVLPVAIQGMSAASLTKLGSIVVFGFVMSLIVTAYVATASRALFASASTDAADDSKSEKPKPAASAATPTSVANLYRFWGGLSLASLIAGATGALSVATAGVPFLLGVIVVSFLYGSSLSASVKKILHPLVFCFLATDAAAVLLGTVTGTSWVTVLKSFLTKGVGPMGAGDFLMAFLGPVILSFGFRMYEQRELMKQNAASMISTITLSSLFGLFATAAVGRAMARPLYTL